MILKIRRFEKKEYSLKEIFFVPYRDFYFVVNLSEIMYIKAEGAYCKIVLKSDNEYLIAGGIGLLLNKLPKYFVRIHNSYIINMSHALSVHDGKFIKLNNNYEVPISRRKKKEIFESVIVG